MLAGLCQFVFTPPPPPHTRGCFGFGNSLGTISPWGSKRPMSQYKEDKKTQN